MYRYVLESKDRDSKDLLTIQNWTIDRELRSVPGVADIVAFGGREKTYEIAVDPVKLQKYNLTPLELYEAVSSSNLNVGGDVIEKNGQAYAVRGLGLYNSIEDIENTIVDEFNGNPLLVKSVATVQESNLLRVGQVGVDDQNDVVEGIVVMRKDENPSEVLARIKEKVDELNQQILPKDVKMIVFYDRDTLMAYCTATVTNNLLEGIILVTVIVFIFFGRLANNLNCCNHHSFVFAFCVLVFEPDGNECEFTFAWCSRFWDYCGWCGRYGGRFVCDVSASCSKRGHDSI